MRMAAAAGYAVLLGVLAACGSSEPAVPTGVTVSPSPVSLTAIGQTRQLSATVRDQRGDPLAGLPVTWSSSNPEVASVSSTGVVTAHANGSAEVTATGGAATGSVDVTVVQTASELVKISGDEQIGTAGQTLPSPLVVQANDALGNPVSGAPLVFAVTQGGGSVSPTTSSTGANGRASTTFTLGTAATLPQRISAGIPATSVLVSFSATGTSPTSSFDITLRFLSSATPSQQAAFNAARLQWQSLITGDLQNALLVANAGDCGAGSPALNEEVDDVVILVTLEPIDGADGTLGQAGPCAFRSNDLPALGLMRFDTADLDAIEAAGQLQSLFLHEMGHVLGFGTVWFGGLLAEPALGIPAGIDPHFTGSQAIAAFDAAGGSAYLDGKVPVENTGGVGTADSHWRESVFLSELMTGFINAGQNPLSSVTVASLGDLGYVVNPSGADSYALPGLQRALVTGPTRRLHNDILRFPRKMVVDAR